MALVERAISKPPGLRRNSDTFKIKAGHMLTMGELAQQTDTVERGVMRKVVRRSILRSRGCMALPLTIAYFVFYCLAVLGHEDITHVFFMESEVRQVIGRGVLEINTIPELWDYFEGDFLNTFFVQNDIYGNPLGKTGTAGDKWGDWGRVLVYNQIQGLVRFECSREEDAAFSNNTYSYTGSDPSVTEIISELKARGEGFVKNDPVEVPPNTTALGGRRLRLLTPALRSSLPVMDPDTRFRFWLYPHEQRHLTLERLKYFRTRQWLDQKTTGLMVTVYLLNADLGRPRLVEVKIEFKFSRAGGIFYQVKLQTMMLKMFPQWQSVFADFFWFCLLLATTFWRAEMMWENFVKGLFLDHFLRIATIWEWLVIMAGWFNVYGFIVQTQLVKELNGSLEEVRQLRWTSELSASSAEVQRYSYRTDSIVLYDTAAEVSFQLGWIRVLMAQYSLVLMFRFFVSFSAQPRLAVVTQTLRAVLPDLFHFLLVFLPTFMAYVISGNLIFGRRIEGFSTVQASFASCFRIILESEFDWDLMAEEHYWTTAIWIWTFIILCVLLLLNMVVAICLDIYAEVRQASAAGEMIWTTLYNYWVRLMWMKNWVEDIFIEEYLETDMAEPMVKRRMLQDAFDDMPDRQLDLLFETCAKEMDWEARKFLDKDTSLKMAGSIKNTADRVSGMVKDLTTDDDPLKSYMSAKVADTAQPKKKVLNEGLFLTSPAFLKAGRPPHVKAPGLAPKEISNIPSSAPPWLHEVTTLMTRQKKWMLHVNYQLQRIKWQMQTAHRTKYAAELSRKKAL